MSRKLYTGAYLLNYSDNKKQFGIIDGSFSLEKNQDKCTILLRREDLKNLVISNDDISFELSLEQLNVMSDVSKSVHENLKTLKKLALRDKLNSSAYIDDDII
ncbi:hypothetical protein ACFSJW_24705 [Flavobacterium artemisiae]|uniref:Uncharacterized protein n=1 Tax=Flavobacterium artemisiae TaxID=2126556 RepID=A0ABW4HCH3_9FLAO